MTFLGQAIIDPNGLWLTEFWNRSIRHVYSLDGTAPGPGPTVRPTCRPTAPSTRCRTTATCSPGLGVTLQGQLVRREGAFTLYKRTTPWKLLDAVQHSTPTDGRSAVAYTYFKPGQRARSSSTSAAPASTARPAGRAPSASAR